MSIVYLNEKFIPDNEAFVSVMDRGFLFGDGIYEVIPVYSGQLFRLEQHLDRLQRSLNAIRIEMTIDHQHWHKILKQLIQQNSEMGKDLAIYLQITRGSSPIRSHLFPESVNPTIYISCLQRTAPPYDVLKAGMKAITMEDTRWKYCYVKSTILLPNLLAYQQAKDSGADETILLRDGEAIEASTSNLFIVKQGVIITPPLAPYILGGITRDLILELAAHHQLPVKEGIIKETELRQADEIWVTSSTKEIYPIIKLDGKPVGNGKVGPVWDQMIKHYRDYKISLEPQHSN